MKPTTTNPKKHNSSYIIKKTETSHQIKRRTTINGSFDYKLTSFYTYLTALSLCDLFSCIFSILNVLEHIQPSYLNHKSLRFHEICLYISIYTHPFAITLQALSVWIICAFSMHRCRSIIKPTTFSSKKPDNEKNKKYNNHFLKQSEPNYFFQMKLKNNCNHERIDVKFFSRKISFLNRLKCFYFFCSVSKGQSKINMKRYPLTSDENNIPNNSNIPAKKSPPLLNKLNKARLNIIILCILAFIYLVPQFFEKQVTVIIIENKKFLFPVLTNFGMSKLYRQLFHLWIYLLIVYLIPFVLILTFNFVLLKTFLNSKRRCKRYIIKKEQNDYILRENRSLSANNIEELNLIKPVASKSNNLLTVNSSYTGHTNSSQISIETRENSMKSVNINENSTDHLKQTEQNNSSILIRSNTFRKQETIKKTKRSRSLTITLFGVVCVFGLCHLPAAFSKIVYVFYPEYEFENNESKSMFSIWNDISNFLIMLNSSVNFILYIVFGPGKFREEFNYMFGSFFGRNYQFINSHLFVYFRSKKKETQELNNGLTTSNELKRNENTGRAHSIIIVSEMDDNV